MNFYISYPQRFGIYCIKLKFYIPDAAVWPANADEINRMGSDRLQKNLRRQMYLAAAVFVMLLYMGHNQSSLWQSAVHTLLPAAFYSAPTMESSIRPIAGAIVSLIEKTIFSYDFYDFEEDSVTVMKEYYPDSGELMAMGQAQGGESVPAADSEQSQNVPQNTEAVATETVVSEEYVSENESWQNMAQGSDMELIPAVATPENGVIYSKQLLYDYSFLMNQFYLTDASTATDSSLFNGEVLLNRDLTMDLKGQAPKILIYHTHSQEKFADSRKDCTEDTIVGVGDVLTQVLEEKYQISVYHDRSVYDCVDGQEDRNEAYSLALNSVQSILEQNPSIMVVIDLHRDGVMGDTHLVTNINGKPTAKIMFFNGLCRSSENDTQGYLQNPYLTDNLAFSLQMQLKAEEKYPDFVRRIYLRNYRYNMHVRPRTLLVECGAQTNTVAEAKNAMEPLADLLYCVLSGQ